MKKFPWKVTWKAGVKSVCSPSRCEGAPPGEEKKRCRRDPRTWGDPGPHHDRVTVPEPLRPHRTDLQVGGDDGLDVPFQVGSRSCQGRPLLRLRPPLHLDKRSRPPALHGCIVLLCVLMCLVPTEPQEVSALT